MAHAEKFELFKTRTGGFSLLKMLLILIGVSLCAVQGLAFYAQKPDTTMTATQFLPATLGLLFSGYAIFFLGKSGHAHLEPDQLSGKIAGGRAYQYPISALSGVDLRGNALQVSGLDGKTLIREGVCHNRLFPGLVWLRLKYRDLPAPVWEAMASSPMDNYPQGLRFFLDPDGRTSFFDAGVVLQIDGSHYFMPIHDTLPTTRGVRGDQSLSTMAVQDAPVLKFEPDPGLVPSTAFLQALLSWQSAEAIAVAVEFVVEHGGCALIVADDNAYAGVTGSWPVRVEMHAAVD